MKIIVRPQYERSRWFRDLTAAMRFAEAARKRQGLSQAGAVEVHISDGRSPHFYAVYGTSGMPGQYAWRWSYAKGW